ncbi:hypothetical protein ACJX0J_041906 [Zea mays]
MIFEAYFSFLISYLISSSLFCIDNSDPKKLEKRLGKRLKTKESLLDPKMREWATEAAQKLLHNLAVEYNRVFLRSSNQIIYVGCDDPFYLSGQDYATDILSAG